ncbi:MAG: CdaR family protein [Ruminococcus sp.]|jgi:hypothetical protein|nr:CdaR family protein [Ruminococcus sp.]
MKIYKTIKAKLNNSLNNNLSIAVYAVIIAIIAWFIISVTIYPSTPKTINNIPLSLDISQTSADENGLSLISCDVSKVNVQIEGDRSRIGNINKDNLVAKLVVDNVTAAGTKTLAIKVESKEGIQFTVKKLTPDIASAVFDKIDSREFKLTPEIPNVTFAEGKTIDQDDFSCDPKTITITGPAAQLDKIAKCAAVSNKSAELESSYNFACDEIKLYDQSGAVIDSKGLEISTTSVTINIPVLTQKTVDLSVSIANAPTNFDKSSIKLKMSADTIALASQNTTIADFPTSLEIGQIPLNKLDLGYSQTFTIDTKDYINQSNLEAVTVTLDDTNLAKKDIVLSDFSISNAPTTSDFKVLTNNLTVSIIAPKDIIDNITAQDLVADVNLLGYKVDNNSFEYPITISCPNYNTVWAVGTYKVNVQRTEKSTTASGT